jgi:hypothetical protein
VFDLRYHVASLVAVFLMLIVGILVGVGISGRGFVDDAERDRFNARIANLQEEVDAAATSAEDLERRQQAAEDFVESAYPVLADRRLEGKRIAVLVVGSVGQTLEYVERALGESGAGAPVRMRAISVPLPIDEIESTLLTQAEFGGYVGEDDLGNLGRDLGREIGRATRHASQVLVAALLPLRTIAHDTPEAARHRAEIDLRDRKRHVAEDANVDLAAVDKALHEHLVPTLQHRLDARGERSRRPHDRSLLDAEGRVLGRRLADRREADGW